MVIRVSATHLTTGACPNRSDKAFASHAWTGCPHQNAATLSVIAVAGRRCFNYDSHDDYQKQYFHLHQINQIHSIKKKKNVVGKKNSNADVPISPFLLSTL
jgi:hypothetical protein